MLKLAKSTSRKGKKNKASCFREQKISESPVIVYAKQDRRFDHYLGHCINCEETLYDLIKQNPGIEETTKALWQLSMDSLKNDLKTYTESMADMAEEGLDGQSLTDQDALGKPLFDKIKKFLLGENNKGRDGLIEHYLGLAKKMKTIRDKKSDEYKEIKNQIDNIQNFFNHLAQNLHGDGDIAGFLKEHRAYQIAEDALLIKNAAGVSGALLTAGRPGSGPRQRRRLNRKRLSLKNVMKKIGRHQSGSLQNLARYKKERADQDEVKFVAENPSSQASRRIVDRAMERLERANSDFRRMQESDLSWKGGAERRVRDICSGRGSLLGRLGIGPFTPTGRRRLSNRCLNFQRRSQSAWRNRSLRRNKQQQKMLALRGRAKEMAQAEAAGYKQSVNRGDLFHRGFGHSDELYSPHLNSYNTYSRYGHQMNSRMSPRMLANPSFNSDPRLRMMMAGNMMNDPFAGQFHHLNQGLYRPGAFGNGPPSYAMPPNFNNPHIWGLNGRSGWQQRSPAGWFNPSPFHQL